MRVPRQPEPRIVDLHSHPKRFVCLTVAAEYLTVDRRTLNAWIDEGYITAVPFGRSRRKIALSELIAFEQRRAS